VGLFYNLGQTRRGGGTELVNSDLVVNPIHGVPTVLEDRLERHVQITTLHTRRLTANNNKLHTYLFTYLITYLLAQSHQITSNAPARITFYWPKLIK